MKIERVKESDFPRAAEVYEASWRESHKNVCTPEFLEKRDCAGYLREKMDGLYQIRDRDVVGVFYLADQDFSTLYIHPDHQHKGYGTACLRYALRGKDRLRLTVLSSNKNAIRLYEKMNFRFSGKETPLRNGIREREMIYTEKKYG